MDPHIMNQESASISARAATPPPVGADTRQPNALSLLMEAGNAWLNDKAPRLGAALAFYTCLSIAPLMVIALNIVAFFFGEEAARGEIFGQTRSLIGEQGSAAIEGIVQNASRPNTGIWATLLSVLTLLLGASGVFGELQDSLNTIWKVKPKVKGYGVVAFLRGRFLSFAMVMVVAFLLVVSLILSSVLDLMSAWFHGTTGWQLFAMQVLQYIISTGIITVLFAMIFKILPDVKIQWNDVWMGALFTGILFSVSRIGISLYLEKGSVASSYGAAGSLVVLLVWVYYAGQILFFGAEMTRVLAQHRGHYNPPEPAPPK